MLAAITETLKASGQPDTPISYWASLMATLEQTGAADGKTVAGIVFLLALVFPKVPHGVLQKHFAGASKMLVAVLQQHAESGSQALMKASLHCVTHLLMAQDPVAWDASGAGALYRALLEFSTDQRAKVRREAQNGVGMLIKTIRQSRPDHPIMESTAKFVLHGLSGQKDTARTMSVNSTPAYLHLLLEDADRLHFSFAQSFRSSFSPRPKLQILNREKRLAACSFLKLYVFGLVCPLTSAQTYDGHQVHS